MYMVHDLLNRIMNHIDGATLVGLLDSEIKELINLIN